MARPPDFIPRAELRRRQVPPAPERFVGTRTEYIATHVEPLLPDVSVVEDFHRALVSYLQRPDAVHLVRKTVSEERKGRSIPTRDGTTLMPTDNAPAWWWHAVLFNAVPLEPYGMPAFISATPYRMFHAPSWKTLNGMGWYVAHVLPERDGDTDWETWPRSSAIWRFVRNIHPCNVFYVPKATPAWTQVGEDPAMIANVATYYRRRYAAIWADFANLARAPVDHGDESPDGPLVILAGDPAMAIGAAPRPTSLTPSIATAKSTNLSVWSEILRPGDIPPVGLLLARHPDAAALTQRLLGGLTVERLVAIADALRNKCRVSFMEIAAPGDRDRQSDLAWSTLDRWAGKAYSKPSGWTGAAKLLADGATEGLEAVATLDIGRIALVGVRIESGPYARSNASGLR